MKISTCPSVMLTATLLAFASTSLPNARAASLVSYVAIGAGNDPGTFSTYAYEPGGSYYDPNGALRSAGGGASFTGLDGNGDEATMTFTGSATAEAQYGMLRTAASGSVFDAYYNEGNARYHYEDDETGAWVTDPDGSPTFFTSFGQAQFIDTLNYGNIPAGFTTDFWFHITGSFEGGNVYHSVYVVLGEESDSIVLRPVDGANRLWTTDKFTPLSATNLAFRTTVLSSFAVYPDEFINGDGASYSGSANFMNTVTLAGINVYDEEDNLVTGWTLTSESGTAYPVPEPSGALLAGLAGALALLRRRRIA